MIRVTIDTMYVRDVLDDRPEKKLVERLLDAQRDGVVEVAVTAVIEDDIPNDPLATRLKELPVLGIESVPRVARLGSWVLGRDVLGSQDAVDFFNSTTTQLPGTADQSHLHAHIAADRDIFLTRDKGILRLAAELKTELGVTVMPLPNFLVSLGLWMP